MKHILYVFPAALLASTFNLIIVTELISLLYDRCSTTFTALKIFTSHVHMIHLYAVFINICHIISIFMDLKLIVTHFIKYSLVKPSSPAAFPDMNFLRTFSPQWPYEASKNLSVLRHV